jgi:hypothetical protein
MDTAARTCRMAGMDRGAPTADRPTCAWPACPEPAAARVRYTCATDPRLAWLPDEGAVALCGRHVRELGRDGALVAGIARVTGA